MRIKVSNVLRHVLNVIYLNCSKGEGGRKGEKNDYRTGKEVSVGKKKIKVAEFIKQLRLPVEYSKGHYASFS
jgi:hypothetical protein